MTLGMLTLNIAVIVPFRVHLSLGTSIFMYQCYRILVHCTPLKKSICRHSAMTDSILPLHLMTVCKAVQKSHSVYIYYLGGQWNNTFLRYTPLTIGSIGHGTMTLFMLRLNIRTLTIALKVLFGTHLSSGANAVVSKTVKKQICY
jgi:hypothetical protein